MGIMGYLREKMGKILAICIGISLLAFIVGEVIRSGGSFFREDRSMLGEVSGEKISLDEFNKRVDQNSAQFKQQQGALSPQILNYVQENTWNQMVAQTVLQKEVDKVGLQVGTDEAHAMVSGNNPNPQIVQAFGDPKTGQLDRNRLNNFLQKLPTLTADVQTQWSEFIRQLVEAKLSEKYTALVSNGLFVNSLDAKDDYENKNRLANFKYVSLLYSSIPDNKVTATDDDYQAYYNDHKAEFKNPSELRSFDYVSFNAAPSAADSAAVRKTADKLAVDFKASTNDSLFVQINAETKTTPITFQHKGHLGDPKLDTAMFSASNGFVYGPYLSNGSYKIAKLVDNRVEADSAKARHILIDERTLGHEKAMKVADSLKKLLEGGASFADLATKFSKDPGSAAKGGDVGYFARGVMAGPFEDAAFGGKKGEYKIVTTQFGVHLIQIEDQKGSSKVVKVAIVDVPLKASSETQTAVYTKAQRFLASLTKDNFDEQVKKTGLKKQTAADVNGVASSVLGIQSARDLVRWAFGAEKGDVSDKVYIEGDQYIVSQLVQIKPKGILSLDAVKKQIQPMVLNQVKGKLLSDKLQAALNGSSTIDQVAQKAGTTANPIQNMVFANPVIPGSSAEYKFIGTIFGSQPNKLSKPVVGQQGVYVFILDSFTNPAPLNNAVREKQQLGQALAQRADQLVFEALKDKANVKDYRSKLL